MNRCLRNGQRVTDITSFSNVELLVIECASNFYHYAYFVIAYQAPVNDTDNTSFVLSFYITSFFRQN